VAEASRLPSCPGAAGKSAPADGWLGGLGREMPVSPIWQAGSRRSGGADEREEVVPANEKRVYFAYAQTGISVTSGSWLQH